MGKRHDSYVKLKAILKIHKMLRTGNSYSGEKLADACDTDKRTIIDYIAFMRNELKASIDSSRHFGYKYNPEKPFSILRLEFEDPKQLDTTTNRRANLLNELLYYIHQLQKTNVLDGFENILFALEQEIRAIIGPYILLTEYEEEELKGDLNPLIEFEEVELRGRSYFDKLYQLIHRKEFIKIRYQGFEMAEAETKVVMPLQLREHNNRWYLVGWAQGNNQSVFLQVFPIDRMLNQPFVTQEQFKHPNKADLNAHFKNMVGVTKKGKPRKVKLKFHDSVRERYALTKKIHPTQEASIDPQDGKTVLELRVICNNELITKILEYGSAIEVLEPASLRNKVAGILKAALQYYV